MVNPTASNELQASRDAFSIRRFLKQSAPGLVHLVRVARLTANQFKYPVVATVLDWKGKVLAGPFQGLRFPSSGGTAFYYEVLGVYEQCLIPVIETIVERPPELVVDVGASWGYYALGFAYRCPATRVIAYEMDATRADLTRKYARLNELDQRIEVRGECTVASLGNDLAGGRRTLVFMDVEGAEDILLQPSQLPDLRHAEIVVELHEMFVEGVTDRLRERFASTHAQTLIQQEPNRQTQSYHTGVDWLIRSYWTRLTTEDRGHQMKWLHLVPRQPPP